MAFNTIIEDTRRMNAKMIAMGQSIDIQKIPRPKVGSQAAQRQAMYTPEGSEVEKMLYPRNFKPRAYTEEPQQKLKTNTQMVEEIEEQTKEPVKIIGDDAIVIEPILKVTEQKEVCFNGPSWTQCKHYKQQGGREFCKEYLSLCGKDKCSKMRR